MEFFFLSHTHTHRAKLPHHTSIPGEPLTSTGSPILPRYRRAGSSPSLQDRLPLLLPATTQEVSALQNQEKTLRMRLELNTSQYFPFGKKPCACGLPRARAAGFNPVQKSAGAVGVLSSAEARGSFCLKHRPLLMSKLPSLGMKELGSKAATGALEKRIQFSPRFPAMVWGHFLSPSVPAGKAAGLGWSADSRGLSPGRQQPRPQRCRCRPRAPGAGSAAERPATGGTRPYSRCAPTEASGAHGAPGAAQGTPGSRPPAPLRTHPAPPPPPSLPPPSPPPPAGSDVWRRERFRPVRRGPSGVGGGAGGARKNESGQQREPQTQIFNALRPRENSTGAYGHPERAPAAPRAPHGAYKNNT